MSSNSLGDAKMLFSASAVESGAMPEPMGQFIRKLRLRKGWSVDALAEMVRMDKTTLSRKETGKIAKITGPEIEAFAAAFEMTAEDFEEMWKRENAGPDGIPVIGRARAGWAHDFEADETSAARELIGRSGTESDQAVAVIVDKDSMEPTLSDGDYVVVEPIVLDDHFNPMLYDGHIVYVRLTMDAGDGDGGCFLARFRPRRGGPVVFSKDNPAAHPVLVGLEHIARLGLVVERRTKRNL